MPKDPRTTQGGGAARRPGIPGMGSVHVEAAVGARGPEPGLVREPAGNTGRRGNVSES